jgi:probable rRNA maturation factor
MRRSILRMESPVSILFDRSGLVPGSVAPLRRHTRELLGAVVNRLGYPKAALSVLYCSRARIMDLNEQYRGFAEVTDVLSFPADDAIPVPGPSEIYLGDLALCLPYCADHAHEHQRPFPEAVDLLLVHGLLHLLGHDHDTPAREASMWKLTDELLQHCRAITPPPLKLSTVTHEQ